MPHIIIETSKNVSLGINSSALVEAAHKALGKELGDVARIKTRLMVAEQSSVGDEGANGTMMHITLLLLEGRDVATKNQYSAAILEAIKPHIQSIPKCYITCEVRDMDKDTYVM